MAKKWAIFNQDRSAIPRGATFEVIVPAASETFVHLARITNTAENATYLDNALTDSNPHAEISVTNNWNPGGGRGIYNDHSIGVMNDEDLRKWAIYNRDGVSIPDGAAFNLTVAGSAESGG